MNSDAGPAGDPAVEVDTDRGDGGVGVGALHLQGQADGVAAGAGGAQTQGVDGVLELDVYKRQLEQTAISGCGEVWYRA